MDHSTSVPILGGQSVSICHQRFAVLDPEGLNLVGIPVIISEFIEFKFPFNYGKRRNGLHKLPSLRSGVGNSSHALLRFTPSHAAHDRTIGLGLIISVPSRVAVVV